MNPIISLCIMKDTPMVSYSTWDEDTQGKIEVGCEVCGNKKHKHGHHHHKSEEKHHKRHEYHKHPEDKYLSKIEMGSTNASEQ